MTQNNNSIEDALVELWQRLFGEAIPINRDDSFFGLGGTSILAVRLVERVEREFGIDYKLSWLLDDPTLHGQSERIHTELAAQAAGGTGDL
ncbi:phosphopantetheine-binding protein [Rhodococcus tibetensis]|uniref:Phosphopantetheine-binding protein n=1 Tax=Rhodococcus tibetensis TaxID=2965064 RepID=A0ABT1QJB1_9NOCA|nr:phosphopantetheine-binding protein [Rhodococcus sp. FXJ9.536]MCQ4122360.1 phosphopantetheine-binding protein [Rhodococcus sp. FXJ9.536]